MDKKLIARFWNKVDVGADQSCWNFREWKTKQGYGKFRVGKKKWMAHRFAWLVTNGDIPEGLFVCHECNNEPCCNPGHLYLGDRKRNSGDAARDGLYAVGERNHLSKLTEHDVKEIRWIDFVFQRRGTRALLSRRYGVTDTNITNICERRTWRHI